MTCLIADDDPIARALMARFVQQHGGLTLVGSYADAVEAARVLAQRRTEGQPVDLAFLDVEMPEMSGLDLAEALQAGPPEARPCVVLVTSNETHARAAFDVQVTDYLLKPPTYGRFLKAVERAEAARTARPAPALAEAGDEALFVRTDRRLVRLALGDVDWIEAQKDYVLFHTATKDHLVHSTMKALEARLPVRFVRVHRSYIVRLDAITNVEETTLAVGRKVIPIGASYLAPLLARLNTL